MLKNTQQRITTPKIKQHAVSPPFRVFPIRSRRSGRSRPVRGRGYRGDVVDVVRGDVGRGTWGDGRGTDGPVRGQTFVSNGRLK